MQQWHLLGHRARILRASCQQAGAGCAVGEDGGVKPGVASSTCVGAASPGRSCRLGLSAGDASGVAYSSHAKAVGLLASGGGNEPHLPQGVTDPGSALFHIRCAPRGKRRRCDGRIGTERVGQRFSLCQLAGRRQASAVGAAGSHTGGGGGEAGTRASMHQLRGLAVGAIRRSP